MERVARELDLSIRLVKMPSGWTWTARIAGQCAQGVYFASRIAAWDSAMCWAISVNKRNTGPFEPFIEEVCDELASEY